MKYFSFCLLIISSYAITCPNMCSGHGSCSSGVCLCSTGFTGGDCSLRQCARDIPYTDPNGELTADKRTALECSGQGKCNRVSGLCECFSGYEGAACQRQKCPNNCNNHGVCTPVNLLKLEDRELDESYYDNGYWTDEKAVGSKWEKKEYGYWDADHSFSCVCDKEWSGYDCSKRKCLSGYSAVSDCDSEAQTTQEFPLTKLITGFGYIEYTDQLGRKWYTDLIEITATNTDADEIKKALQKLPPGVIDLDSVTYDATTVGAEKIVIKFGKHQTGKQTPIRIIGKEALDGNGGKEFGEQKAAPGYHGMYAGAGGATLTGFGTADILEADVVGGISPLVCGGNGICNTDTGVCECFDNYYGLACTEQKELI